MKVIKCTYCHEVLDVNDNRFIAKIQEANNEQRSVIRFLVLEDVDFCTIKCLYEYMKDQLSNHGPLV